jgi:hypothetical protein
MSNVGVTFTQWLHQGRDAHGGRPFNSTIASYITSNRVHCPSTTCAFVFLILPIGYAVLAFLSWRRMRNGCCRAPFQNEVDAFHLELGERELQRNNVAAAEQPNAPRIDIV